MAKTDNITVKWVVDTSELEKSVQISARADQATAKLRQSTDSYSKQASAGFKSTAKSVEGMEQELARLRQQIKLTSTADTQRLNQLSSDYRKAKAQLDAYNKSLFDQNDATKKASSGTQSLASQFGNLYSAVRLVLTAGIVRETVDISLNMARLAGNVEGVERAFNRAFPNADALINQLRRSTHGTVSDFELMQRTLQATNLGVNVEQLGVLFEFAAVRAQQTGESVNYLVDSIVRGIGRKSILVLDNLGLSATRLKEQFDGTSIASKSVGEVTEGVAEIARQELEKMGGYAETSATKVDQLTVAWKELKIEAAQGINDLNSSFIDFLTSSVNGLKLIIQNRGDLADATSRQVYSQAELLALQDAELIKQKLLSDSTLKTQQQKADFIQQEINSRVQLIGSYNDEIKSLQERYKESQKGSFATAEQTREIYAEIKARQLGVATIRLTMKALQDYLQTLNNSPEKEQITTLKTLGEQLSKLKDEYENTNVQDVKRLANLQREILQLQTKIRLIKELNGDLEDQRKIENEIFQAAQSEQIRTDAIKETKTAVDELSKSLKDSQDFQFGFDIQSSIEESIKSVEEFLNLIKEIPDDPQIRTFGQRLADAFNDAKEQIGNAAQSIITDQLKSIADIEAQTLEQQLRQLRSYYDEQIALAGDNERAKDQLRLQEKQREEQLRKELAEADRKSRRFSIIIDTAAGIIRAFATLPTAAAIVQSGIIAALGASELAVVNRAKYAKGKVLIQGPGTDTSDSIPVSISRNESIIKAAASKKSPILLEKINNMEIDDRILKDIQLTKTGVKYVGSQFNDERIVKAIRDQQSPDFIRIGNNIYEAKRSGETYTRLIRRKSMS